MAHRIVRTSALVAVGVAGALLIAGCTPGSAGSVVTPSPSPSATESTPTAAPTPSPTAGETPSAQVGPVVPAGQPVAVLSGLAAPWSIAPLADGSVLISERDTGRIVENVTGSAVQVAQLSDVAAAGEGGLLGLAPLEDESGSWLYAYYTTASDNRVVRMPLGGTAGAHTLGAPQPVLTGLPKANIHNGGRIAFGPDGMLYATVGDANQRDRAQDPAYLGGKILRITPDGQVPGDNPTAGSPVWTVGHRNPQGIAWKADGTMWAAEFGQDTWDEINVITPGSDYGWPQVEGLQGGEGLTDPVAQWSTDQASPSGIAAVGDTILMAGLGGERLFTIGADGASQEWFVGELGRIRDVVKGPGNSVYLLTNNTDGRGDPRPGDDVLYWLELAPAG